MEQFLRRYLGYEHDFLGVVAVSNVSFALLFGLMFAFSIKVINSRGDKEIGFQY